MQTFHTLLEKHGCLEPCRTGTPILLLEMTRRGWYAFHVDIESGGGKRQLLPIVLCLGLHKASRRSGQYLRVRASQLWRWVSGGAWELSSESWDGVGDTKRESKLKGMHVTFNITTQVVTHFIQNEVDIFFGRNGMVCNISWSVGSASYSHLLPGQEENNSPITGRWVKKSHALWAGVKRKGHIFLKSARVQS